MTDDKQKINEPEARFDDEGTGEPEQLRQQDDGGERAPLLSKGDADRFRERWQTLQAGFVDQPREMVEEADSLVAELMQQLTAGFDERRTSLEEQWEHGNDVSTEDLRVTLTRYRSFFDRLLSA